jgi:hypothetical protein
VVVVAFGVLIAVGATIARGERAPTIPRARRERDRANISPATLAS